MGGGITVENPCGVQDRTSLLFNFKGWLAYVDLLSGCSLNLSADSHTEQETDNLGTFSWQTILRIVLYGPQNEFSLWVRWSKEMQRADNFVNFL